MADYAGQGHLLAPSRSSRFIRPRPGSRLRAIVGRRGHRDHEALIQPTRKEQTQACSLHEPFDMLVEMIESI